MIQTTDRLTVRSKGRGLHEITGLVTSWLDRHPVEEGLLTLLVCHTSASLLVQENADPTVCADLDTFFHRLVPEDERLYRHNDEGPDDMPAHIRAALTQTQLSIPVIGGRLALGPWQGLYLFEHRAAGRARTLALHLLGA